MGCKVKIIGLTGGVASGKSTVAITLEALGAIIIDGDKTAHSIMEPHQPAWEDIVKTFGPQILREDLTINRDILAPIVFNDPAALDKLNHITHPRVMESINDQLNRIKTEQPDAVVIMDIPLLYETHMDRLCQEVWVVWVDRETQINRLMNRNGFTRGEAVRRIQTQASLDEKASRADKVIDNSGSLEETIRTVTRNFNDILHKD
jgi:dephospho-CoA kinase